jgi:hypothetical protein
MTDPSTSEFQLCLPRLLLPISPPLSARHASRVRLLYPTESILEDHCSKCGSFLLNGNGNIRLYRKTVKGAHKKEQTLQNFQRRTCQTCGFCKDVPVGRGNASLFPKRKRTRVNHTEEVFAPVVADSDQSVPQPPPQPLTAAAAPLPSRAAPDLPQRSKKRPKKSGLQEMLSRNREKEKERQLVQESGSEGLASFLSNLQNL